jgi:hypothetical protein
MNPKFREWLEFELMKEFEVDSHEKLYDRLVYCEIFYPEELRRILAIILRKWRGKKKRETVIV